MKVFKKLKLGDHIRDANDKLKDMPDDTGDTSVHLSLSNNGQLSVTTETETEDDNGEPVVEERRDKVVQESRFDAFITRLQNGIADNETTYSMTDVVNLVLELACLCRGVEAASRQSCEEIAEAAAAEAEQGEEEEEPGESQPE